MMQVGRGRAQQALGVRAQRAAMPALRHDDRVPRPGRRQPQHLLVPGVPAMTRADHLPPLKRVGHKGADLIAPGNTIESFQAALDHGVHMIEFDILPAADGRLVLAHDPVDAASRECVTLEEGLEHFAGDGIRRRRARRGPEGARLRARGRGGAGGVRPRRALAGHLDLHGDHGHARPAWRARTATRMVGPARPARLHEVEARARRVRRAPRRTAASCRSSLRGCCGPAGSRP